MTDRVPARTRKFNAAVATAALPAVMLSAVALAPAAQAAEVAPPAALQPRSAAVPAALPAAAVTPSAHVPGELPQALRAPAAPASYVVVAGDTVSGIAARHGLSTAAVLSLNGLSAASIIRPGQAMLLAAGTPAAQPAAQPAAPSAAGSYTVRSGDTLSGIAARHGVSLASVLTGNGLGMNSIIRPGQQLSVGAAGQVTVQAVSRTAAAAPAAAGYTVASGDTLYGIAARQGVSASALAAANSISLSATIQPGQVLTVPGGSALARPQSAEPQQLVPSTFLHYTYPQHVVAAANENKRALLATPQPSRAQMQAIIADTARSMGVSPSLALAHAYQESGFNMAAVSPANAIGAMQVIPSSGEWASDLVGRRLNLLNPYDNATAGVAIIRALLRTSPSVDEAIASYYQGQGSVQRNGMFSDTRAYVSAIKAHQRKYA